MIKNNIKLAVAFLLALALLPGLVSAAASFAVTSFACSPSEAVINSLFSCTATIQNTGDAAGTLNTATLYPDSGNWMENSNYAQAYGQSINPGNSATVTFSGLRATKSGNNGFARILLDSATDTYVADNNEKINIINVAVTISNSASSKAMNGEITTTAEVTAGGNVDVSLTWTASSGGCSIGSQTNPKSVSGMTDGAKQSRTWTITQGTTGDCIFSVSAAATGVGGVATKTDTQGSTITCSDCPVSSSSSSSGGGGGGGGGGAAASYTIGSLETAYMKELKTGDKITFGIVSSGADSKENHTLTIKEVTNTSVRLEIASTPQTISLAIGETKSIDLNADGQNDISVKLESINAVTQRATIIITPLVAQPKQDAAGQDDSESAAGSVADKITDAGKKLGEDIKQGKNYAWLIVLIVIIIVIIAGVIIFRKLKEKKIIKSVLYRDKR